MRPLVLLHLYPAVYSMYISVRSVVYKNSLKSYQLHSSLVKCSTHTKNLLSVSRICCTAPSAVCNSADLAELDLSLNSSGCIVCVMIMQKFYLQCYVKQHNELY